MHVIHLQEPAIDRHTATFRWTVVPATPLYRRTSFELRFPESVDLSAVPAAIWWHVALACLHPHWGLLRPCRVILPVRLASGEREFWLRMCDAEVTSLEARGDGGDTARDIDLVEAGPALAPLVPGPDEGIVAACFSGGRDSLAQTALLQELGERPLLVATTSPREASQEHETARRNHVMREITRRRGLELIEVDSDFRSCCDNTFSSTRYGLAVSEMTDTLLYFAVALAVAAARGARRVCLASEAEVQETARVGGAIIQHTHLMYSAITQRALQALLEPTGIRYGGLTYPLFHFQIQRLLVKRFADLRDLQYSCWELAADQSACSRCSECREVAFNVMAEGVSPSELGIDLTTLLAAQSHWRPGENGRRRRLTDERVGRHIEAQMLRCLDGLTPDRMAELIGCEVPAGDAAAAQALHAYQEMRAAALVQAVEPEPGYRAGFLELIDEPLRAGLGAIFDEHFARAPRETYAGLLERTLTLSDWISAPLRMPELDRRSSRGTHLSRGRPRPSIARPPAPAPLDEAELAPIRECIPDPEPPLVVPTSGRALRVAETLLDGNELRYVTECVETNWVSSRCFRRPVRGGVRRGRRLRVRGRMLERHHRAAPRVGRCGHRPRRRSDRSGVHHDRHRQRRRICRCDAGLRRLGSDDVEPRSPAGGREHRPSNPCDRRHAHLWPAGRCRRGAAHRRRQRTSRD